MDKLLMLFNVLIGAIIGYNLRLRGFRHERVKILQDCLKELERIDTAISQKLVLKSNDVEDLADDIENIFIKYHKEIDG